MGCRKVWRKSGYRDIPHSLADLMDEEKNGNFLSVQLYPFQTSAVPLIAGRSCTAARCDSFLTRIKNYSFSAWGRAVNPLLVVSGEICAFMMELLLPVSSGLTLLS